MPITQKPSAAHRRTSPELLIPRQRSSFSQLARWGWVAVFALLCSWSVGARDLPSTKAEREGFSSQRLARIGTHMNQAVADGTMVGGLGLVARNGRVVYSDTWGMRDREARTAMTSDSIFRIYSMSKPITGVALMMLFEEGKFLLNEPVAKYLPELAGLEVALATADAGSSAASDGTRSAAVNKADSAASAGATRPPRRQPTIRDLMRHTAGFTYGVFGNTEVDRQYREAQLLSDGLTLEEFVKRIGKIPLQYEPGDRWHYSVSVDIQGRLVEALSGQRFGDFLQQRIFAPLGMVDTSFFIDPNKRDRVAKLYAPEGTPGSLNAFLTPSTSDQLMPADDFADRGFQPGAKFESGGGGLLSTAMDYLRFCQMLLNGGELNGVRLLSPRSVAMMSSDQLGDVTQPYPSPGVSFGLNFAVVGDPGARGDSGSAGEYNWGGAAGTKFWIDPQENVIGVFMVQSLPHRTTLGDEFKVLTYQALLE